MPTKSGKYWVAWANTHAKNSNKVSDLELTFRGKLNSFKAALINAGAKVIISTTKRSDKRAYLFHWSWKISQGKCAPSDAKAMVGVDIQWNHNDLAKSKAAALEMVKGFGLAVPPRSFNPPSLSSNHITGKAIDMTIKWTGVIDVNKKDGTPVSLTFVSNVNTHAALHAVGESYGVKKLKTDIPHWSYNGH